MPKFLFCTILGGNILSKTDIGLILDFVELIKSVLAYDLRFKVPPLKFNTNNSRLEPTFERMQKESP